MFAYFSNMIGKRNLRLLNDKTGFFGIILCGFCISGINNMVSAAVFQNQNDAFAWGKTTKIVHVAFVKQKECVCSLFFNQF